ncbi:MAG: GntR family transcriptional regulator [Muribaculaceae bacterium]|nr:GntR family transcriptional regulator [Muribaculaceae bacterium]
MPEDITPSLLIGRYNTLRVARHVDFGIYLSDGQGNEVLLPARYLPEDLPAINDNLEVFVYRDTEDRPIATTLHPYATVGEVAFLQVAETNAVGAFLDWGLDGKDLLVPFREQKSRMLRGGIYPVYVYLDHTTGRVVASAKIEKFLGNTIPHYRRGAGIKVLVMGRTEIGYRVIVDNLFLGMLYENEVYRDITVGESMEAYVKNVRPDGKIDVTLNDSASRRITPLADNITEYLASHGGKISITDRSDSELIHATFHCSKKDYKKALGYLYKNHLIEITPEKISLINTPGKN